MGVRLRAGGVAMKLPVSAARSLVVILGATLILAGCGAPAVRPHRQHSKSHGANTLGISQHGKVTAPKLQMPHLPSQILPASTPGEFDFPGASGWDLTNGWNGSIGWVVYSVMAGAMPTAPKAGMLVVASTDEKSGAQVLRAYPLQGSQGPLTITSESGGNVFFKTADGADGYFTLGRLTYQFTPHQTTPVPKIFTTPNLPNATYTTTYILSKNAFTDEVRWQVVSGALASDPSTGVLIAFDASRNEAPTIVTVPTAGQIEITGFSGDTSVDVKSKALGQGSLALGTNIISWSAPSALSLPPLVVPKAPYDHSGPHQIYLTHGVQPSSTSETSPITQQTINQALQSANVSVTGVSGPFVVNDVWQINAHLMVGTGTFRSSGFPGVVIAPVSGSPSFYSLLVNGAPGPAYIQGYRGNWLWIGQGFGYELFNYVTGQSSRSDQNANLVQ